MRLEQYSRNSELFNRFFFIWWWKSHQIKDNKDCGILGHEDLQASGLLPTFKRKLFFLWRCGPTRAMASSFMRFLDNIQRRSTVGRTPLDEWSARRRYLYLTTHNAHNRQTSMPPAGFEPMISASELPLTYALDCAATGTGLSENLFVWIEGIRWPQFQSSVASESQRAEQELGSIFSSVEHCLIILIPWYNFRTDIWSHKLYFGCWATPATAWKQLK